MSVPAAGAIRLDKRLAAQFGCARGAAQQYIEGGWVAVDGVVVEQNQALVTPAQRVELDPQATLAVPEPATLLLHKPAGLASADAARLATPASRSTTDDSGIRLLQRHFLRLGAPLPLADAESGLLVLSQDGRVWRRLTEDAARIEQEYVVEVDGQLDTEAFHWLARGHGRGEPQCKLSWQSERRLRFAGKGLQPGELHWRCAEVGLQVHAVHRLRIGRVALKGMAPGTWRHLPPGERF